MKSEAQKSADEAMSKLARLDAATFKRLLEAARDGAPKTEIGDAFDADRKTVTRWFRAKTPRGVALRAARADWKRATRHAAAAGDDAKHAQWLLERLDPTTYGRAATQRHELKHSGSLSVTAKVVLLPALDAEPDASPVVAEPRPADALPGVGR